MTFQNLREIPQISPKGSSNFMLPIVCVSDKILKGEWKNFPKIKLEHPSYSRTRGNVNETPSAFHFKYE